MRKFKVAIAMTLCLFCRLNIFAQGWTLSGTTTSTTNQVVINSSNPANMLNISNGGYASMLLGNNDNGGFVLTKESSDSSFNIWRGPYQNASLRFSIRSSGNVYIANKLGLGTLPAAPLHVNAGGYAAMLMGNNDATGFVLTKEVSDNSFNIWSGPFGTGSQNRLKIDQQGNFAITGNVGIFTGDTKGYQLAVNGNAIFNKVVVKPYPNWPDYVFDSAYQLRPLAKVDQYIKANHHLPEIPSADSVEKAGMDVGANQAALLKKIEELTLYVIEQNKLIQQQTVEIQDQAARLDEQVKRINLLEQQKNK
jgi:hypothetical protein